ncbi:MAG: glycosyltransferase family 2 protein [Flavobacteriia bacterium]|nr:glycosyltransferase family 2 protein [Flavobacteriia bacterium]
MNTPKISVAICTYNREKYLPQLFQSIEKQTLPESAYEILLIDNNSPGNTHELFTHFLTENPSKHGEYFLETNQGLSHARNRAIQESNAPLITFLDDDAFIDVDYLNVLVNTFENYPEVGAIGGPISLHYEDIIPKWENKYLNSLLGYFNRGNELHYFSEKDYPRGSNMAFRTLLFEKTGTFDVQLGRIGANLFGGEEKDLFNRIYKQKISVLYQPDARVFHCVPNERTTFDFIKKQALGTGQSERIRSKAEGTGSLLKRIFSEGIKWMGSFVLWFLFAFKGQPSKGNMILFFRYWVSYGLVINPKKA